MAFLRDVTTTALAPSLSAEALPAVTTPPSLKNGLSFAIDSRLASRRGHSSVSTTTGSPLRCGMTTGTISSLKRPLSMAATALRWLL